MSGTAVVIPCHDEAERLRPDAFLRFAREHEWVRFRFVDDGSADRTGDLLDELCAAAPRCAVTHLPRNLGKGEAVRAGLVAEAKAADTAHVGFLDADLATPLTELPRFRRLLERRPRVQWVLGSRVKLLGRTIERSPLRHYPGRVFAAAVSLALELPVYDTQCGAKLFRPTAELREILARPFVSRWLFDVEMLARLIARRRRRGDPPASEVVRELPLREWIDPGGSKVKATDALRALPELLRIRRLYLRPPMDPRPG